MARTRQNTNIISMGYSSSKQGLALTGRNSTGPPRSVTDDDRRQRASLVWPHTLCRRASDKLPIWRPYADICNSCSKSSMLDGKYSERVQLPAKAIADCHHNGGVRLMEQPLLQCWSTNHVPTAAATSARPGKLKSSSVCHPPILAHLLLYCCCKPAIVYSLRRFLTVTSTSLYRS